MLEILQFVFSGFWVWLGTVVLVSVVASCFYGLAAVVRGQ